MIPVQLSAEDFRNIHNGACSLDAAICRLGDVLSVELLRQLRGASTLIRAGLKTAYLQEENIYAQREAHFEEVGSKINAVNSVWSISEVEDLYAKHPFPGADTLEYDSCSCAHTSVPIKGDRWVDLWAAAEQTVTMCRPTNHIFIEGFFTKEGSTTTLALSLGS